MYYTFKFWFEEADDVVRILTIKPTNTFAQLHTTLQEAVGFDKSFAGKFYISDDKWRKKECISDKVEGNHLGKLADIKVSAGVSEPFQKFVYVADEANDWIMLGEMIAISAENAPSDLPTVIKQSGNAPKQQPNAPIMAGGSSDMDDITALLLKSKQKAMQQLDETGNDAEPDADDLDGIEDEFADTEEEEVDNDSMFEETFGEEEVEDDEDEFGEMNEGEDD